MNQDNKNLMDKYKELPDDVREAIFSVDSADIIQGIAKKNNLTIDKMSDLADEIGLLMLGVTEPKDFISNISRRLGVDRKIAHDITAEVNEKIFSKIRESLKKIHNIKDEDGEEEKETKLYRPQFTKPQEPPQALSREDILKEIEEPEAVPIPSVPAGGVKPNENPIEIKPIQPKPVAEEEKELSLPPPPPAVIEEKEESVIVAKENLSKEEVKSDEEAAEPKTQISRRPPEVSEHDGDENNFGPGGDRYPGGDPYREPVK